MKTSSLLSLVLSLLAICWMACNPSDLPDTPIKERTYLHVLNAYSGLPSGVDMRFTYFEKKQMAIDKLTFKESWPPSGYASLLTEVSGDSSEAEPVLVTVDVLDNPSKEALFAPFPLELGAGAKSTVCLIDSFGKPLLVKTIDSPKEYESQTANIRFMNLNSAMKSVSLHVKADTFRIEKLNFLNYSSYELIPSGTYTFYFVNDFTSNRIDSVSNLSIKSRQAYSFYLTQQGGIPVGAYEILE